MLGGTPVSMEFKTLDEGASVGRYYYRSSLGDLFLKKDAATGEWQEQDENGKPTGRLALTCAAGSLKGEWRSMDGTRRLAITGAPAAEDQYGAARRAGLKPMVQKAEVFQKRRYEILTYGPQAGGTIGLRLSGSGAGLDAVNRSLQDAATDAVIEHLNCRATGRLERGPDAGYDTEIRQELVAWNDSFVVVRTFAEGYCGGAHPWHFPSTKTYRLDTGSAVDLSTWLLPPYRSQVAENSPLGRLLLKAYARTDDGDECKGNVTWTGADIHPLPGQLVFETSAPYALTPCAEDVSLPLSKIERFLSPEGKLAMKAFRQ